jgi:predicted PurR-regulated permease PerM
MEPPRERDERRRVGEVPDEMAAVLAPLIQRRAVDLPPVLTLAAVALFGTLFGAMGVALATPLVAALKVAVTRLYIEDRLGGGSPP